MKFEAPLIPVKVDRVGLLKILETTSDMPFLEAEVSRPEYLKAHTPPLVRLDIHISKDICDTYHIELSQFKLICQEKYSKVDDAAKEIQALKKRLDKLESSMQNIILDRKEGAKIPDRIPAYIKRY